MKKKDKLKKKKKRNPKWVLPNIDQVPNARKDNKIEEVRYTI